MLNIFHCYKPVIALFSMMLLIGGQVHAVQVDNLYTAEVEVANQESEERNRAVKEGLKLVFVKVTGNNQAAQNTALSQALRRASGYVQQYRYHVIDIDPVAAANDNQPDAAAQIITEKRFLKIRYDKLAVDKLLRSNGLPVWGNSRPQVLTWVGIEKQGSRKMLLPEFQPDLVDALSKIAERRGIPLLFPLMDLKDQGAVSPAEIWGAFAEPVRTASQRYQADEILLIRLKISNEGFTESSWSLLGKDEDRHWQVDGAGLTDTVNKGLNQMADLVAQQYAPAGGNQLQVVNLQVNGVSAFEDLYRIENFLTNQETVQRFQVRASWQDKVVFALSLRGGIAAFVQAIDLSGLLLPEDMPVTYPVTYPVTNPDAVSAIMPTDDVVENVAMPVAPDVSGTPESPLKIDNTDLAQNQSLAQSQNPDSDNQLTAVVSQPVVDDVDRSVPFKDVQLVYLLKK